MFDHTAKKDKPKEIKTYDCPLCEMVFNRAFDNEILYEDSRLLIIKEHNSQNHKVIYKYHMPSFEEVDMSLIYYIATDRFWLKGAEIDYAMTENKGHAHCILRDRRFI